MADKYDYIARVKKLEDVQVADNFVFKALRRFTLEDLVVECKEALALPLSSEDSRWFKEKLNKAESELMLL